MQQAYCWVHITRTLIARFDLSLCNFAFQTEEQLSAAQACFYPRSASFPSFQSEMSQSGILLPYFLLHLKDSITSLCLHIR